MSELTHTRSCPQLTPNSDEECTCGLRWRIALQTEQTMHAAWRKRAEEAEFDRDRLAAENAALASEARTLRANLETCSTFAEAEIARLTAEPT